MKAGDEITVNGKVYIAGDARLLRILLGFAPDAQVWKVVCDYCKQACKLDRCLATLYDEEVGRLVAACGYYDNPNYFFLKPEPQQPITGESK